MGVVLLLVVTFVGYVIAYNTYGRFLARKVFRLSAEAVPPAQAMRDGVDFVPTPKGIIFGHHYTSIAGTGPIVGPAIGIIWGWVPALVWVFVGSIVMGAVHDLGSLVISLRNQGKSISDIAARIIGPRTRYIFFLVVFLELLIVIAIFGLVIAVIFKMFPQSVFPVWMEIPIAALLGWAVYRRSASVKLGTFVAVAAMYVTVAIGHYLRIELSDVTFGTLALGERVFDMSMPATGVWTVILLTYAFIASTIPVNRLLQPRDYINAWQLFVAMALIVCGAVASGLAGKLSFAAPAFNRAPEGAPAMFPFLFITIACGAISGFHCLVSSGTTSKQLCREPDALLVGYGSMLIEGALAIMVLVAVGAGIAMAYETASGEILTGAAAWQEHYASWTASKGLTSKITAVVVGSANMMESIGVPRDLGIVIMGVFIASFAGTTLDSATRIQRYVVTELAGNVGLRPLTNRYAATTVAVVTAALLAFATGANGKGALALWPMFGAVNQLLAALALMVITNYLIGRGSRFYLLTAVPCLLMLFVTLWAVIVNEKNFVATGQGLLAVINGIVLVLAVWLVAEGSLALATRRGPARQPAPGGAQ